MLWILPFISGKKDLIHPQFFCFEYSESKIIKLWYLQVVCWCPGHEVQWNGCLKYCIRWVLCNECSSWIETFPVQHPMYVLGCIFFWFPMAMSVCQKGSMGIPVLAILKTTIRHTSHWYDFRCLIRWTVQFSFLFNDVAFKNKWLWTQFAFVEDNAWT